jgi:hypothetical protein
MNYKKVLEKLGFIEGKDFALTIDSFEMLQQSKMVNEYTFHPKIEATYHDVEISPEIPATYDEQGIELTPLVPATFESQILTPEIPAWNEKVLIHHDAVPAVLDVDGISIITPEIPAYDEEKMLEEFFTLDAPSLEILNSTWKNIQIEESDISLLINEFLIGKDNLRDQDDSINIINGNIHTWNFKNIPQPTQDELITLIAPTQIKTTKEKMLKDLKEAGKKDREMCENVLNLIGGFNRTRVLTSQQVTDMQTTFSTILLLLQANRPSSAKALIEAIVPDEVLITTEIKNLILDELVNA